MSKQREVGEWPGMFTGHETPYSVASKGRCELEGKLAVLAEVHMAWGMCMSGMYHIPEKFGTGMVLASHYLGIDVSPGPELNAFGDRLLQEHKVKYGDRS